ncbi:MAG: rhodanese-like domain-containing protein [Dehalococcoidales bacterium]|nr:MAG: rhodanese-like domain-containing protein [Dehalococcoidales bacterium]
MIFKRWLMSRNRIVWLGILLITLTCVTLMTGCTSEETITEPNIAAVSEAALQASVVTDLSAQEAYTLIQEKMNDPDFKILDVRTPDEYNIGHVEGAINIDYNSDGFKEKLATLDRSGEYLVYCRSGNRSSGAVKVMEELGFTMIYHMTGGIIDWSAEGLPLDR